MLWTRAEAKCAFFVKHWEERFWARSDILPDRRISSSFLLQAQNSKAQIIGRRKCSADTISALKQGAEFGLAQGGQKNGRSAHAGDRDSTLGLDATRGLQFVEAFYWDQNDETRAFSKRSGKNTVNRDAGPGRHLRCRDALPQGVQAVATRTPSPSWRI